MRRRQFLKGVGVGLAASLSYRAFAQTASQVRWRLVSSYPRSLDTLFGGAEDLAKRVAELTGGRFQIRAYQAGEIVPGAGVGCRAAGNGGGRAHLRSLLCGQKPHPSL